MAAPAEIPPAPAAEDAQPAKRVRVPADPDVMVTPTTIGSKRFHFKVAMGKNAYFNVRVSNKEEGAGMERAVFGAVLPRNVTVTTCEYDPKSLDVKLVLDTENAEHAAFIEFVDIIGRRHAASLGEPYYFASIAQPTTVPGLVEVTVRAPETRRKLMNERASLRDARWVMRLAYISTYHENDTGRTRTNFRLEIPDLTVLRSFDSARPAATAARLPRGEEGKAALAEMEARLSTTLEF
jgi:hypothetical protein